LTLFVRRQDEHPACYKLIGGGAGLVVCLELDADLQMAQMMTVPLSKIFSKIHIGFTFLVLAHPGSPGQKAVVRVG